jgi:Protein of unknown function with PCYCGC motif
MGRKSSAKRQTPPGSPEPPSDKPSSTPLVVGGVVLALLAVGALAFRSHLTPADPAASSRTAAAAAPEIARHGPHPQATLPPLNFPGYELSRPPEVIRAAYEFAAVHPEVSSYVPCFCGCDQQGHRSNEDCFVAERDANGDVTRWEDHGMECAVCIDVATQSAQMYRSGASVKDIRAAIDKTWAGQTTYHTPTPLP